MIAGAVSLREVRKTAIDVLNACIADLPTLPPNNKVPTIVDTPVWASPNNALPEIHIFDGGRDHRNNSALKIPVGKTTITLGIEVTVKAKEGYADYLDELSDAVLEILFGADDFIKLIGKVDAYNTRPDFEKAETPLARNVITVTMTTQEKFKGNAKSGNPAPLEEVANTLELSEDENKNITVIFRPPQPEE